MDVVLNVFRASVIPISLIALALRNLRQHPTVTQAGRAAVRESWLTWIGAAHLALVVVLVGYLATVGFNTAAYDYSFWNEPPPSDAADTAAVISLWMLYVFVCLVAAVAYGWMCERAAPEGRESATIRSAFRRALPDAPIAVVGLAVIFVTLPVSIPAAVAIAALGAAPMHSSSPSSVAWTVYVEFVRSNFSALFAIGLGVSLLAVPIDITVLLGFYLTENYNGSIEATVLPLIWFTVVLASLAAGWAAGAYRRIWLDAQPTPA
jgi:hypothetical protein